MSTEIPTWATEIIARLERIETALRGAKTISVQESETMTSNDAMALLGYKSRKRFWISVKASGVPFIRVNSKRIIFNRAAVESWMQRRTRNASA